MGSGEEAMRRHRMWLLMEADGNNGMAYRAPEVILFRILIISSSFGQEMVQGVLG